MMMPTWLFYVFYVSLGWVVGMVSVMAYMLGAIRARVRCDGSRVGHHASRARGHGSPTEEQAMSYTPKDFERAESLSRTHLSVANLQDYEIEALAQLIADVRREALAGLAARLRGSVKDSEAMEEGCGMDAGNVYMVLSALYGDLTDIAAELERDG